MTMDSIDNRFSDNVTHMNKYLLSLLFAPIIEGSYFKLNPEENVIVPAVNLRVLKSF
jgi:hypothetical protein